MPFVSSCALSPPPPALGPDGHHMTPQRQLLRRMCVQRVCFLLQVDILFFLFADQGGDKLNVNYMCVLCLLAHRMWHTELYLEEDCCAVVG